jgi:ATP-dependent exoDNAse (exonuclease V) beta subunit
MKLTDQEDRDRIVTLLDETLIVEAAAGTGKTTELVRRIIMILESGRARIREIVAVTFTEKAAGELKLKIREELEKARRRAEAGEVLDGANAAVVRDRLTDALAHLEEAHVSTLHGFCGELLRERPVEARVDPLFTVLTEGQARSLFDRAFDSWLGQQIESPPAGVRRALRRPSPRSFGWAEEDDAGAPVDRLRNAAWCLAEWRDFTREWRQPEYDRVREIDALVQQVHEYAALTESPDWARDSLYEGTLPVRQASEAIRRSVGVRGPDHDGWEAQLIDLLHEGLDRIRTGRAQFYKPGVPRAQLVDARDRLVAALKGFRELVDADLAALLSTELRGVLRRYDALKRQEGALDFMDLLLGARDLLRSDPLVRATLQSRFEKIFVDEFQDTDPLQAEILLLLASGDSQVAHWREVVPTPGKLFIVADPKQSIYRFRRADVGVYYDVRAHLRKHGAKEIRLRTSFRARPAIQAMVNAAFAPEMTGDEATLQADYVPLAPFRAEIPSQPAVVALPAPRPYGRNRKIAKKAINESLPAAVAAYVDWLIHESNWKVSDRTGEKPRSIRPGDVCLLFRRFISGREDMTRPYVEALEARGIEHVLVGGRTFHRREEVESVRAALAAIEWPEDNLSVFATLRGPLFAVGDEELLEWRHRFGRLHPFAVASDGAGLDIPDSPLVHRQGAVAAPIASPRAESAPRGGHRSRSPAEDPRSRVLCSAEPRRAGTGQRSAGCGAGAPVRAGGRAVVPRVRRISRRGGEPRARRRSAGDRGSLRRCAPDDGAQGQGTRVSDRDSGGHHGAPGAGRARPIH